MNLRLRLAGILCVLALLVAPPTVLATPLHGVGVGLAPITMHDPVSDGAMPGYVFYPATEASHVTWRGPYELHATPDAPPIPGAKPLVVISHGHGGSDLGHHDLAVYLASHGFVVATLEHPKDNFHDMSGTGTPQVLEGRPVQVKAAIRMLLADPHWKTLIDPHRIGVAGFSAGGYTALTVVGAVPRFERFIKYCKLEPSDQQVCHPVHGPMHALHSQQAIRADIATLQTDLDKWGNTADPRVKAAFVMAPLGLLFDKAGLAHIHVPVFLLKRPGGEQVTGTQCATCDCRASGPHALATAAASAESIAGRLISVFGSSLSLSIAVEIAFQLTFQRL